MATQLQIRRGTTAQMNAFTGAEGELAVNTTTDTVHVHDGSTAGGFALAKADGSNIGTYAGSFTTISASGAITATGIDVTGTATMDAATVQTTGSTTAVLTLNNADGNGTLSQINLGYTGDPDHGNIKYTGAMSFQTGGNTERLRITSAGQTQVIGYNAMTLGFPAVAGGASRSGIKPTITGAGAGQLEFLVGGDNNTEATTVAAMMDSSGNVGIGTSSPNSYSSQTTLTINGSTYGRLDLESAGTLRASLFATAGSTTFSAATDLLTFDTSGGEAMRIDSSGNLLVGTTTAAPNSTTTIKGALGLVGTSVASTSNLFFNNSSNVKYWGIATDQNFFYITDADFTHYAYVGQSMTSWGFASDRRLKENIVDVPYGLDAVMAIQPRAFKFKSSGVETIGFVAQELQAVVPEAVTGTEVEYLDSDTPQEKANKSLGVSKDTLIPVLVKAIQEQQATIEALTQRIETLENN